MTNTNQPAAPATPKPAHELECPTCFRTIYWCKGHGR